MRIVFAVFFLLIAYVTSYPSLRNNDASNNDLELELRSILNSLNDEQDSNEQMARSFTDEDDTDDDDDDTDSFSKRQGGHNMVNKGTKCEIECVHAERNPSVGKGKTIKEAAKVCKNKCLIGSNKRGGKHLNEKKSPKRVNKMNLREFDDDDDDNNNSNEEQQNQRREFYDYLIEQIQRNNNE